MSNEKSTQGGTHEQHVKAGQQSHKNSQGSSGEQTGSSKDSKSGSGQSEGGKSDGGKSGVQGGTHEQHVNAGKQSHKNS